MSFQCDYTLELNFSGPILSQAPGVLALGVDNAMQRYRNQPVLNGSLIRGNIRHALTEFAERLTDDDLTRHIDRWFGSRTSDDRYTPNRAEIDFDFFWKLKHPRDQEAKTGRRPRIALEEESGSVKKGALQVIEACFPTEGDIIFIGGLCGRFASSEEKRNFTHWLGKALDYIPAIALDSAN